VKKAIKLTQDSVSVL